MIPIFILSLFRSIWLSRAAHQLLARLGLMELMEQLIPPYCKLHACAGSCASNKGMMPHACGLLAGASSMQAWTQSLVPQDHGSASWQRMQQNLEHCMLHGGLCHDWQAFRGGDSGLTASKHPGQPGHLRSHGLLLACSSIRDQIFNLA